MTDLQFRDSLFDERGSWRPFYKDERFEQRYRVIDDVMFSETLLTVRATASAVVSLLQQSWDWWAHGKVANYARHPDGSSEMDFKPIWWYVARLRMTILPPEELPGHAGTRLPVVYARDFEGPGTIDVYPDRGSHDVVVLRGRFHGVRQHVRMPGANATTAVWGHLWTEAGRLPIPFARGTGYVGLIRKLETESAPAFPTS